MIKSSIEYDRPSLEASYDFLGIVDGLSEAERTKFQITDEINSLFITEELKTRTALVNSKKELVDEMEKFFKNAEAGERFILHFVSHGNEHGIGAGTDFVAWDTFIPILQRIHEATDETLLLNMSTCKGLYGTKIVPPEGQYPFFGLIGAKTDLVVTDALKANKIMYKKWIEGKPIQQLIPETNTEMGKDVLFNLSAEGYRKLTSGGNKSF